MVVTPMDYLPDLGDIWMQAGGVWHASDAIHFEYPGFVAPQGFAQTGLGTAIRTIADWYSELPWYVTMFLPFKWSTDNRKVSYDALTRLAADLGVTLPSQI